MVRRLKTFPVPEESPFCRVARQISDILELTPLDRKRCRGVFQIHGVVYEVILPTDERF